MPVNMGKGKGGKGGKGSEESEEKMEMGMCLSKDEVSFSRSYDCFFSNNQPIRKVQFPTCRFTTSVPWAPACRSSLRRP